MRIIRGWSTNKLQPTTSPFPEKNGVFVEFRGGDFCHPRGQGKWFEPPYFDRVTRFWLQLEVVYFLAVWLICLSALSCTLIYVHGGWWWLASVLVPAPLLNPGMFISWRFGKHGGYIGAKAYGVDSPAYLHWLPTEDVYNGSQAIMFSIRPHATLEM